MVRTRTFKYGQKFWIASHLVCGRAKFLPFLLLAFLLCEPAIAKQPTHQGTTPCREQQACDGHTSTISNKKVVMKKIIAKRIDATKMPTALADIPAMLDAEGVGYNAIDSNNWPDAFPYTPRVEVRVAHTGNNIILHYRVEEKTVRAVAEDNGKVWEDACCEFFSIPAADGVYYNIECNCAGQMLIGSGAGRKDRERATKEVLDTVKRWSSLGREPFAEKAAPAQWQLVMVIPASAFFKHHITSFAGTTIRANFYKCGDMLQQQHYLSWNPIGLPRPNFHCPEFFGEVVFE